MTPANLKTIKLTIEQGIAWVSLNRPEKRNAMSPELHEEMDQLLMELEVDDAVKVVVLTGEGEAWCAGQDLQKFFREGVDKPHLKKKTLEVAERWRSIRLANYDKPTIAMVNGYCFGGAFTQLISCDYAIAAEDAIFGLSEINWGILPGGVVSKVVVDTMPFRDALYYATTGETFDGKKASELRLVNKAVPKAKLKQAVIELATVLMQKNPETLRATKHCMRRVRGMDYFEAFDYLAAKGAEVKVRDTEGGRAEAMKKFLDEKSYRPGLGSYKRKSNR